MKYTTGYDFWRDLLIYGRESAIKMANEYLDMQDKLCRSDPEEYSFCCQLYDAMQQ